MAAVDVCKRHCKPLAGQQVINTQSEEYGATYNRKELGKTTLAPHNLANDKQ